MLIVKISSKNQITLPKKFLQLIGAQSGDRLFLQSEKEKAILYPLKKSISESLFGVIKVKPGLKDIPFEKALQETKKIVAGKLK